MLPIENLWFILFRIRNFEVLQRTYSCTHVAIIIQQDATICNLFISVNYSTCFGWYLQPSSEAHITASTVTVSWMPDTVDSVIWAPDDGWKYHPKHVEKFIDIDKLYIVASCWIIFATYYTMHVPFNIKSGTLVSVRTIATVSCYMWHSRVTEHANAIYFWILLPHTIPLLCALRIALPVIYLITAANS